MQFSLHLKAKMFAQDSLVWKLKSELLTFKTELWVSSYSPDFTRNVLDG
jgi:hypothetical protein